MKPAADRSSVVVLVVISPGPHGDFVPHLSVTVALGLTLVDLAVLIYSINHIATSIQLPHVIAGIARDLSGANQAQGGEEPAAPVDRECGPSWEELLVKVEEFGAVIRTPHSGYLQFIRHERLVRIAADADAVIHLPYRPGHFLVKGHPLAAVWPAEAAAQVEQELARGQVTGPYRTLTRDVSFGVDQLVEIAIRALSPAVNDTFTAMTRIDRLGDCLCRITTGWHPRRVRRDPNGWVRLIAYQADYDRLIARSFEKIRQAGVGMPAVMIRQLDALSKLMEQTLEAERRQVLMDQADLIQRACDDTVREDSDRRDVRARYRALQAQMKAGPRR